MKKQDFQHWLAENDHLEFSRLLDIREQPLELIIGMEPENEIGSGQLNRVVLQPVDLSYFDDQAIQHIKPSINTEIRTMEIDEEIEDKIALTLYHSHTSIRLVCGAMTIRQLPPITINPAITFSETRVTLSAPPQDLLAPDDWISALAKKGINACFRHFGGSALDLAKIPADYTGYFITKPERLAESNTGVFISASKSTANSMYSILECQDKPCLDLWMDMINHFAKIEGSKILFNDVLISGARWLRRYEPEFRKRL